MRRWKTWAPGHDQKLRADLERRVGGLLQLKAIVEEYEARQKEALALAESRAVGTSAQ
jgi:hypothetical protein